MDLNPVAQHGPAYKGKKHLRNPKLVGYKRYELETGGIPPNAANKKGPFMGPGKGPMSFPTHRLHFIPGT